MRKRVHIYSSSVPDEEMLVRSGREVAEELCSRRLIRYLGRGDLSRYLRGDANRHFTTPTPYAPDDLIGFLNLPDPETRRTHCLLLDPEKIDLIQGPRYIPWGGGIEYLLPNGFDADALINQWGMEIR